MDPTLPLLLRGYPSWLFKAFVACYVLLAVAALAACTFSPW